MDGRLKSSASKNSPLESESKVMPESTEIEDLIADDGGRGKRGFRVVDCERRRGRNMMVGTEGRRGKMQNERCDRPETRR